MLVCPQSLTSPLGSRMCCDCGTATFPYSADLLMSNATNDDWSLFTLSPPVISCFWIGTMKCGYFACLSLLKIRQRLKSHWRSLHCKR